jgi:hypothetical protein
VFKHSSVFVKIKKCLVDFKRRKMESENKDIDIGKMAVIDHIVDLSFS